MRLRVGDGTEGTPHSRMAGMGTVPYPQRWKDCPKVTVKLGSGPGLGARVPDRRVQISGVMGYARVSYS